VVGTVVADFDLSSDDEDEAGRNEMAVWFDLFLISQWCVCECDLGKLRYLPVVVELIGFYSQ
jgi:hypothetical protein